MNKLLGILLLMFVSNSCFGWSLLGPKDYDDCILENMKGVTSDNAAGQIRRSCKSKFPHETQKTIACVSNPFTSSERSKLEGTANVSYGYLSGKIYNGSQKTIHSAIIRYKSNNNKLVDYEISNLSISPLTSGTFNVSVTDYEITKLEWDILPRSCD